MLPSLLQFGWSLRPCLSFNFLSVLVFDKKKAGGVGDGVLLNAIDEFSCLCLKHNFSWSIVHVFQGDGQRILLPLLDI